jgi:hypothetical protein
MPVSRKHRSMKKSSKRSKNVRTSKKTRKHMRKMRGGGDLRAGVNQAVDFIIYSGDNVLVAKNPNVTPNVTNNTPETFALVGTFASSGGETNKQRKNILEGIERYNTSANITHLVPLEKENALILLKKKLSEKGLSIDDSKLENLSESDNTFHAITEDKRLKDTTKGKDGKSCMPGHNCKIFTQLFNLEVASEDSDLFTNTNLIWKKSDSPDIFSDHKKFLKFIK